MTDHDDDLLAPGEWRSGGTDEGADVTADHLQALRQLVRELGHYVKPGSRVFLFERQFSRFLSGDYDPRTDQTLDTELLAHGARDLTELLFICEMLRPRHEKKLREALPTLLSGPVVPRDTHDASRDLQFELYVGAQLLHSGFEVAFSEPDVMFALDATRLGIAAKRITSERQLIRRTEEGVEQIRRAGTEGIVALSLDRLMPGAYVVAGGEPGLDDAARELHAKAFIPRGRELHAVIRDTPITGLMTSLCVVGCVRVPWHPAHVTAAWWFPRDNHLPREGSTVQRIVSALRVPSDRGGWHTP